MSFFMVSYISILVCRLIPRKIMYSMRILIYAVAAGVVYVPTVLLLSLLFPETVSGVLIYIEISVVNLLLLAKTESRFYLEPFGTMAVDALVYIAGYAVAAFAVGIIRELLAYGTIFGLFLFDELMPAARSPFFGFILVGILAAVCRVIVGRRGARK